MVGLMGKKVELPESRPRNLDENDVIFELFFLWFSLQSSQGSFIQAL